MEHHAQTKEIWSQMHQRLLSYIRGRVSTPHDADDLLQDVFVRIHANLDDVKDTENVTAWVYQITRNVITDYYRQRAKAAGAIKTLAEEETGPARLSDDRDCQTEPESEPSTVMAGCMEPLMKNLPEPYRRAVTLTELDGLTQKDAAERLGLSISGMKSRVGRGRSKLKELLLGCCNVELDSRGAVVDYEQRDGGTCGDCDCR